MNELLDKLADYLTMRSLNSHYSCIYKKGQYYEQIIIYKAYLNIPITLTNRELHQKNKMSVDKMFPRKLLYHNVKILIQNDLISSNYFLQ